MSLRIAAALVCTLAIAAILGAAPAAADYRVCMELCTKGRDFAECHGFCREGAGKAPTADAGPVTLPKGFTGTDCSTAEVKMDLLSAWIEEHYGPSFMAATALDHPDLVKVKFSPYYPTRRWCEGIVRVADDCRLTDAEGNAMNARARERTLPCE